MEKAEKTEKMRLKYLKDINYTSDGTNYSFEFEGSVYTLKGFPSIIDKAKIRAIFNSIAPTSLGQSSSEAIYLSGDNYLQSLATAIAYSRVLLILPEDFDSDSFCLDKDGETDENRYYNFGLSIIIAEIEFQKSKKKQ